MAKLTTEEFIAKPKLYMGIGMTIPRWSMLITKPKSALSVKSMESFGKLPKVT